MGNKQNMLPTPENEIRMFHDDGSTPTYGGLPLTLNSGNPNVSTPTYGVLTIEPDDERRKREIEELLFKFIDTKPRMVLDEKTKRCFVMDGEERVNANHIEINHFALISALITEVRELKDDMKYLRNTHIDMLLKDCMCNDLIKEIVKYLD